MNALHDDIESLVVAACQDTKTTHLDVLKVIRELHIVGHRHVTPNDVITTYKRLTTIRDIPINHQTPTVDPTCERCNTRHPICTYDTPTGNWAWNTSKALDTITKTPRNRMYVPRLALIEILRSLEFDKSHLNHVDTQYPGISVPFDDGMVLIDGTHRAAKCVRDNIPFFTVQLTQEEADACLLWPGLRIYR